jgi:hypothetical protein
LGLSIKINKRNDLFSRKGGLFEQPERGLDQLRGHPTHPKPQMMSKPVDKENQAIVMVNAILPEVVIPTMGPGGRERDAGRM